MEFCMNNASVGMIGLGLLGCAIGERLIAQGCRVQGYDVAETARAKFCRMGGLVAADVSGVFACCDLVLLSLPSDVEVRQVLQVAEGSLHRNQIILDTTTGNPDSTISLARELAAKQLWYLDATISGSSEQARQAQALWMVGGDRQVFERCVDFFRLLTNQVIYTGPSGTGAKMKLVTNLVLGLNRAALAEGLAFARALGLEAKQTIAVLRSSMAYSRIMDTKGEKMILGDFSPQARLSQHLKDVRLMLEAAAAVGLALPLADTHRRLMEQAEAAGLGELDNSAIIRVFKTTH